MTGLWYIHRDEAEPGHHRVKLLRQGKIVDHGPVKEDLLGTIRSMVVLMDPFDYLVTSEGRFLYLPHRGEMA